MQMNSKGKPLDKVLSTQERIAIAQCLNLAVEEGARTPEELKSSTKRFYKVKTELEEEFLLNGNKF